MATTSAIVVALRANSSAFRKGFGEGRAALKEFRDDAKRTREYLAQLESGNNGVIGTYKAMRTAIAAAGLAVAARSLRNMSEAALEFSRSAGDADRHWTAFAEKIVDSIPIVRDLYATMKNAAMVLDPMADTEGVRQRLELLDKERKARLDASNAAKKARDDAAAKAKADAKAKFELGQAPVEDLRNQLIGLMGEDTALQFKLNAAGATDAQRSEAEALQAQIREWQTHNERVSEARTLVDGLAESARKSMMSEREYTLAKLASNEATADQLALAERALDLEDVQKQIADARGLKPELAVSGADSVAALTKGSVAAAQAERRNEANAKAMTSFAKQTADNTNQMRTLLDQQTKLTAELTRIMAQLEAA